MTAHLHAQFVPTCTHLTVTCDNCGEEIHTPLIRPAAVIAHPDAEAANEIAGVVMDVLGWQDLSDRYGIAHRVLHWLDANRPDGLVH